MSYVSKNYDNNPDAPLGKWVSHLGLNYGECVSYVRVVAPKLPETGSWRRGKLVKGDKTIARGTVIATFKDPKTFLGHAAIYESQNDSGVQVVDQYYHPPKAIGRRTLRYTAPLDVNNGGKFYVVE